MCVCLMCVMCVCVVRACGGMLGASVCDTQS